jgi:hypothetical protein
MRHIKLAALLTLLLGACDTGLIDNPSFDRWCGEELCDWETTEGKIERTSSWHKKDYAVAFEETPTEITQLVQSGGGGGCVRFDVIADVQAEAELKLFVNFGDNGSAVVEQMVAASNWAPTSFLVREPSSYKRVRYTLRKIGRGRAVLAQMWAESTHCDSVSR